MKARLGIAVLILSACGLQKQEAANQPTSPRESRPVCQAEAVQLEQPLSLRAAPEESARVIRSLPRKAFVYLCEERAGLVGVMVPEPGEPVDCSHRSDAEKCDIGWAAGKPRIEIIG